MEADCRPFSRYGFLTNRELTPLNRLRGYLETGLSPLTHNQCTRGCLLGNLGQELADPRLLAV